MAKFSYEKLRFAAYLVIDAVSLLFRKKQRTNAVLVVRDDAIGDFVMWLDAARALVEHYRRQDRPVVLLANKAWAGWARELRCFAEVMDLDLKAAHYDVGYRFRLNQRVRRAGFAVALQPAFSRSYLGGALVRLSGAPERVGFRGDTANLQPWEERVSQHFFTRLIESDPTPRMELLRNSEFVREVTQEPYEACIADLLTFGTLPEPESFRQEVGTEPYYVLFPGASWIGKQWPLPHFAELTNLIHARTGWRGIVCGGPLDRDMAAALCELTDSPLENWAGMTTLPQMASILAGAAFLVSNDTSAVHIASAVGTETICVLGGGHFGRFLPYVVERSDGRPLPRVAAFPMPCYGCNWRCIFDLSVNPHVPCVKNVSVQSVWAMVSDILAGNHESLHAVSPAGIVMFDPPSPPEL